MSTILSSNFYYIKKKKDVKNYWKLSKFKNVKTLKFQSSIDLNDLKILKNFKELEIIYIDVYSFYQENLIKFVDGLMKLKDSKKTKIQKIYLWGFELIKPIEDFKMKDNDYNYLKFQLLNYELLGITPYRSATISYDFLIIFFQKNFNLFKNKKKHNLLTELPYDFFLKFNNIKRVIVQGIRLDEKFIVFLSNCSFLVFLKIIECKLKQSLLDQLPNVSNYLYKLVLRDLEELENQKLNLNFILKIKRIGHISTRINLDIQVALNLLNDSNVLGNNLEHFQLYYLERPIELGRIDVKDFFKERHHYLDEDEYRFYFFLRCNKEISLEYLNSNKEYKYLFKIGYFNEKISRLGLTYEQSVEFIQNIPIHFENELANLNRDTLIGYERD